MAFPTVTYSFTNGTTADATQVNQNFNDLVNGISDTTKDISINAATLAGTATLNGNVILGSSSSKTVTFNGSLATSIVPSATGTYDLGSTAFGMRAVYIQGTGSNYTKLASIASGSRTINFPAAADTANSVLQADGGGQLRWTAPTFSIQVKTSGTAQNYYTPANCVRLKVRMVGAGGGGGGGGSATGGQGDGQTGNATTFGALTANGGGGGFALGAGSVVGGGTGSIGGAFVGFAVTGASTPAAPTLNSGGSLGYANGANGAATPFGDGGAGGSADGNAGVCYGSGGGGAGTGSGANNFPGYGGAAGGYIEAWIVNPAATYTYTVGVYAGGTGVPGAGGTAPGIGPGGAGGAGAPGVIIVEEYYV